MCCNVEVHLRRVSAVMCCDVEVHTRRVSAVMCCDVEVHPRRVSAVTCCNVEVHLRRVSGQESQSFLITRRHSPSGRHKILSQSFQLLTPTESAC